MKSNVWKWIVCFLLVAVVMYGFVGPSMREDWGVGGVWYRMRTYPTDWTNAQLVFGQFRFLSWAMIPAWGELPVESMFLWAGPFLLAEVLVNNLFRYDGAAGVEGSTLIGFDGNFSDKDGDGSVEDDSFWGTSIGLGPRFRYHVMEGLVWNIRYVPVYRFYSRAERTVITMPDAHWTHEIGTSLTYTYEEGVNAYLSLGYQAFLRDREYRWGYGGREVFPIFDQMARLRGIVRIPFEGITSRLKLGGGLFWRERGPIPFGVSSLVLQEEMSRDVRGYHEERLAGRAGVLVQTTYEWDALEWLRIEVGLDGIYYQAMDASWRVASGGGVGVRFQWHYSQALVIEYNHPFRVAAEGGQMVMGFVWLFGPEGL